MNIFLQHETDTATVDTATVICTEQCASCDVAMLTQRDIHSKASNVAHRSVSGACASQREYHQRLLRYTTTDDLGDATSTVE